VRRLKLWAATAMWLIAASLVIATQVTLVSITWREAPGTFPGDKRRVVEEVKFIYQSTGERK
jgi:hypothetical protein